MSFYVRRGDAYEATELTRGPWSPEHQHGGPPAALLAGHIAAAHPDRVIARVAIDFLRPVPIGRVRLALEPATGRRLLRARGALLDDGGTALCVAEALLAAQRVVVPPPPSPEGTPPPPLPEAGSAEPARFPFFRWDVGYHTAMELRFGSGGFGAGRVAVWMRPRVALVEGVELAPVERVLCAVDSVHGVSWRVDPREMTAINADLIVGMHRMPRGEWVCLEAETAAEPGGVGIAHSRLWDGEGPLGWSLQTLLLERRAAPPAP